MPGFGDFGWESTLTAGSIVADWPMTVDRYYLLDYDGGSDSNGGYIDAAPGSVLVPAGIAWKTIEHLLATMPRFGAGRSAVILIKPRAAGATYLASDGATPDTLDLSGFVGFSQLMVRGSTDLTNSTTDRVLCGSMVASVGPNVDSSWTVAAAPAPTANTWAIAAGALAAEPTLIGYRVRMVTGALAGAVGCINAHVAGAGGTVTLMANLGGVPVAGDTFVIERPGVRIQTVRTPDLVKQGPTTTTFPMIGIGINTATTVSNTDTVALSFCELVNATAITVASSTENFVASNLYTDEAGSTRNTGAGLICRGALIASRQSAITLSAVAAFGAASLSTSVQMLVQPAYFGGGVSLYVSGTSAGSNIFGSAGSATMRPVRIAGTGITVGACDDFSSGAAAPGTRGLSGISFTGVTVGTACIIVQSTGGTLSVDGCLDGGGNTVAYGINAVNATNTVMFLGISSANTIAGATGQILTNYGRTTHAAFTVAGGGAHAYGPAGNNFIGTAGASNVRGNVFSNQSAATLAVGELVRSNGTTGQVTSAFADTQANADGTFGVVQNAAPNAESCLVISSGAPWVLFDAAPTVNAMAYLSVTTTRRATTTVPPAAATNRKLRLGWVTEVSGNYGRVEFLAEKLSVLANGVI